MKKDLNWFKEKLEVLKTIDRRMWEKSEPNSKNQSHFNGSLATIDEVLDFLSQLDEPEVLSQEWIDEHEQMVVLMNKGRDDFGNVYSAGTMVKGVPSGKLENLLVPKQEEVDRAYKAGYETGKQHTFYKGYLEGLGDKGSEPETVADVISDFYKSLERFKEVLGTKVEELEE